MMGLAKMSPDGWAYYAEEVACGREDYFVGHGEEPGTWVGRAAERLGLPTEVDKDGLARIFGNGLDPLSGSLLSRAFTGKEGEVAGFALSFSPPKSVSILWAVAPDPIAAIVRDGHDAAVSSALAFLQDHACFTRRGHGGSVQERARGYLAAAFVHRTSRAGDPQLHTHLLVANRVQAVTDGRWLALDGRELYEVQKAAGMLYKAALRAELTDRLGVRWSDVGTDGAAEILGVPDGLIAHFSKRRVQVEAAAARMVGQREQALGRSLTSNERAAVHQLAAYQSRPAKAEQGETTGELQERWRADSEAAGYRCEDWLRDVFGQPRIRGREATLAKMGIAPSFELVVTEVIDRLEREHSTWGRSDLVEVLTVVLPTHRCETAGAVREMVEAAADAVLANQDVVLLTNLDRPNVRHGALRYCTTWTLQTEQAVLDTVQAGRQAAVAVVEPDRVEAALAGLGDDQMEAVRGLCGDGERVSVLIGPAGSGKTRTLAAARQAWQVAGVPVRGVAPSAVAAGVLTEGAGIGSETLAKFLLEITKGHQALRRGEVIVCDEASMVSTRDLARLVLLAEHADAKVVLVGDHYQLGSVDAGGMFRLLANDAKTAELTTIRRFNDPWEAKATGRLRRGDATVISEYANRNRIRAGNRDQALDAAHRAWRDLADEGRSVVVMAGDHDTVDQLAMRARATRVQTGQVEPAGITIGNQTVGVGDEIVTTRNDRRLVTSRGAWVRNGDRWKIARRGRDDSLILDSLDGRGKVTVPPAYVHDNVSLAYAVTVHKAQGLTVDHGVLVVNTNTSAEHLYVGMTRGRAQNLACIVAEPPGDEHSHGKAPAAADILAGCLQRTSSELSATETLRNEAAVSGGLPEPAARIVEGLQQARRHGLRETIRRQSHQRAHVASSASPSLEPTRITPDL